MTPQRPAVISPQPNCPFDPAAFTLLEVLVALGILVAALAGIAALLPAAGARLAEATAVDRATAMAANARADVVNRGLAQWPMWQSATGTSGSTRAIVFGEGVTSGGTAISMTSATNTIALAEPTILSSRIDPTVGFYLQDQLQVSGSVVTGFVPGICYGCMLSATDAPTGAGPTVRLTTAVFRKPSPAVQGFALTAMPGSAVFQVSGTLGPTGAVGSVTGTDAAPLRKQFLAPCSWILAISAPGQPPQEPRWIPVASSWTNWVSITTASGPSLVATGTSFITLSGTDHLPFVVSGTLQAFGFEGLLRVDERFVPLE